MYIISQKEIKYLRISIKQTKKYIPVNLICPSTSNKMLKEQKREYYSYLKVFQLII